MSCGNEPSTLVNKLVRDVSDGRASSSCIRATTDSTVLSSVKANDF